MRSSTACKYPKVAVLFNCNYLIIVIAASVSKIYFYA